MQIRIVNEKGIGKYTKVYTESGEDISGCITSINIEILPNKLVVANMFVNVSHIDLLAHGTILPKKSFTERLRNFFHAN